MEIPDMSHYGKCRMMMKKHERHHMLRFKLVAFLMLINAYGYIHSPIEHGISIFIYSVITLAISLFAVPEKPKLLAITCILLLIGIIGNLIRLYFGIPMLLLFLSQIPETKQAVWIKQQERYPYFNERFTEKMQNFSKEYQPEHKFDDLHDAEMSETPSPDFMVKEMPSIPEFTQDILETNQMQNNDLGTDRILMKHSKNNMDI